MLELNIIKTGVDASSFSPGEGDRPPKNYQWTRLVNYLADHTRRRVLVIMRVVKDLEEGRHPLVVCDRKDMAEQVRNEVARMHRNADEVAYVHGALPAKDRDETWRRIGAKELRCVVGTNLVDGTGGDLSFFDTVHLATPPTHKKFIQRIRGLLRNVERENSPIIRYYLDESVWLDSILRAAEQRLRLLLKRALREITPHG